MPVESYQPVWVSGSVIASLVSWLSGLISVSASGLLFGDYSVGNLASVPHVNPTGES